MESKIVLCLLIQCGILFQAFSSLSEISYKNKLSAASSDRHDRKKRIIDVTLNRNASFLNQDVPYVVLIINATADVLCTGTILSPRIVITAAHCVKGVKCFVESGGDRSRIRTVHDVLIKHVYQNFDVIMKKNDLSLLVLKQSIDVVHSYHRAIQLYEGPLRPNSEGLVTGWGSIRKRLPHQFPSHAQSIKVFIIEWQECRRIYTSITSHEICTYYGNKSRCCWAGDSGAPLVVDGRLVGVFSWFRANDDVGYPDVFMNLLHPDYKQWVNGWVSHFRGHYPN